MDLKTLNSQIKVSCKNKRMIQEIGSFGKTEGCKLVVVLDNPSLADVKKQQYLSGFYAQKFIENLMSILNINDVYFTSAVKRYQELGAKNHETLIKNNEFEYWKQILLSELKQVEGYDYILCLGSLASQCFQTKNTISEIRGSYTEYNGKIVFHMNNPNAFMRDLRMNDINELDLKKFSCIYKGEREPNANMIINPTFEQSIKYIQSCYNSSIALDIETKNNKVACFSLSNKEDDGICIPLHSFSNYSKLEKKIIIDELDKLFQSDSLIICHNALFDIRFLRNTEGLSIPKNIADTMIMHYKLYEHLPHKLGFLCSTYTMYNYYKDDLNNWKDDNDTEKFFKYNIKDSMVTLKSFNNMQSEFSAVDLSNINEEIKNDIIIFSKGVNVNQGSRRQYEKEIMNEYVKKYCFIRDFFKEKFNIEINDIKKLTDKYIKDVLIEKLGIKIKRKTDKLFYILNDSLTYKIIFTMYNEIIFALMYIIQKRKEIKEINKQKTIEPKIMFDMNMIKKDKYPTYIEKRDDGFNLFQKGSILAHSGKSLYFIDFYNKGFLYLSKILKDNVNFIKDIDLFKDDIVRRMSNDSRVLPLVDKLIENVYKEFDINDYSGIHLSGSEIKYVFNKFNELYPEINIKKDSIRNALKRNKGIMIGKQVFKMNINNANPARFFDFAYNAEINTIIKNIAHEYKNECIYYDNNCIIIESANDIDIEHCFTSTYKPLYTISKSLGNNGSLQSMMDGESKESLNFNNIIKRRTKCD